MVHDKFTVVINKITKEAQVATMISNLIELEERTQFICNLIIQCREDTNRKLLVLSDRLDHLNYMIEKINELNIGTTSKYVGGMKQKKLDEAECADIIFSTYSMSSEALDISTLNTVILATSRRNVEQSVGRILRKQKGNYLSQPLVIDVVDNIRTFINQGYTRKTYYKKITNILNIKMFDYENGVINENIKTNPESVSVNDNDNDSPEDTLFVDSDSD